MKTIGAIQQRAIDQEAAEAGLPTLLLMEEAGREVCEFLMTLSDRRPMPVNILCGKGNNGGDGYVAARLLLAAGWPVRVWETAAAVPLNGQVGDAVTARQALIAMGLSPEPTSGLWPTLEAASEGSDKAGILVDALLGTGFRSSRPLDGEMKDLCRAVNARRAAGKIRVVAIDIPSGVDAGSGMADIDAIRADYTLTFVYPKAGMVSWPGRGHCGEILTRGLGLSPAFLKELEERGLPESSPPPPEWVDADWLRERAPLRPRDAHKGTFGHAAMICGGPGMLGAALLAARAALQSGLGLLTAYVPASLYSACIAAFPSALWRPLPDVLCGTSARNTVGAGVLDGQTEGELSTAGAWEMVFSQLPTRCTALLIGPGLGGWSDAARTVLLERAFSFAGELLLDADALNCLAAHEDRFSFCFAARRDAGNPPPILTPHPGEFARLAPWLAAAENGKGRLEQAWRFAADRGVVLALKGAGTVAAFPDGSLFVNSSGNAGMGKGGSGDALAGLLLGLLAQGLPTRTALPAAIYLHGLAGDLGARSAGERGLIPELLITKLPEAFAECGWETLQ